MPAVVSYTLILICIIISHLSDNIFCSVANIEVDLSQYDENFKNIHKSGQ